ncbi:hypothetical protein HK102_001124 [Quaeritorhiza haematococci]|nr:hypothetical protein HK102_001124 [Quaeritorhiza haematococci]
MASPTNRKPVDLTSPPPEEFPTPAEAAEKGLNKTEPVIESDLSEMPSLPELIHSNGHRLPTAATSKHADEVTGRVTAKTPASGQHRQNGGLKDISKASTRREAQNGESGKSKVRGSKRRSATPDTHEGQMSPFWKAYFTASACAFVAVLVGTRYAHRV